MQKYMTNQVMTGSLLFVMGLIVLIMVLLQVNAKKPILGNNPITKQIDKVWCDALSYNQNQSEQCVKEAQKERQTKTFL